MRVYNIECDGYNKLCEIDLDGIVSFLENADIGDEITIDIGEMSEIEYNGLPEFEGF